MESDKNLQSFKIDERDVRLQQLNNELLIIKKENERINKELEKWKYYAQRDEMTEIINKREGMRLLEKEIEVSFTTNKPLTICFIDIDDLKEVNDTYGHVEGDNLIIDTVNIIIDNIRKYDIAYRFGGDEFVIIFPNTIIEEAAEVWNRINNKVNQFNAISNKYMIKLSHGICEYPIKQKISIDEFLNLADKKMYENKQK